MNAYPNKKTMPSRKGRKSERNKVFMANKKLLRELRKQRAAQASQE
jgi:hypothetical protein